MKYYIVILFICCVGVLRVTGQASNAINNSFYGVPSSPAFDLLPDKPSEVTHITTPRDFTSVVPVTVDGKKIKTGLSFDFRPFAYNVGSLKSYQDHLAKQVLWRTVLSAGTASKENSDDAFLSVGIRIPIIDKGDPRADKAYTDAMEKIVTDQTEQPDFESVASVNKNVADSLDAARKKYIEGHWNAFRLDVGFANMWLAQNASIKADSIDQNRLGAWAAASFPVSNWGQVMVSAKNSWVSTESEDLESGRFSLGARFRVLIDKFALSVEFAKIWSSYSDQESLNENWNHFGALLEIPVPKLKGVIGLTYGGDTDRREDQNAKFEFKYSIYTDRLINK
jgi:hypothetical protein